MRLRDLVVAVAAGIAAAVAGVGLLYVLRGAAVGHAGPKVAGALPLEQLARADAQPLLRMLLAWLPAGVAVGAALGAFTRTRAVVLLSVLALVAGVVLVGSAAVSDAVANNQSVTFGKALGAAGTWVSLGILVIGAAGGELLGGATARAPSAD